MYKRPSTQAVMDFCNKHKVSFDWLPCGDLKGLHRMTKEAKAGRYPPVDTCDAAAVSSATKRVRNIHAAEQTKRIMEMYNRMTPEDRRHIEKVADGLLEMQTPPPIA